MRATALTVLLLLLLAAGAQAQVSLSNFKCSVGGSDTTSTLHVLVGDPFLCTITVTNTSAGPTTTTVQDVRLTPGSWAEQSSYAGSVETTQLQAGQSTTAIFTNIKARQSGDHRFESVTANGLAGDTTHVLVKASTPMFTTIQVPPGTIEDGTPFEVLASVTGSGRLSSARLTLTTDCTTDSNATTRELEAIPDGAIRSTTFNLVQKSGGCGYRVEARVTGSPPIERGNQGTVSTPSTPVTITPTVNPSLGSGPGGEPPKEKPTFLMDPLMGRLTLYIKETARQVVSLAAKGAQQVLDFAQTEVSKITFTLKRTISSLVFEVHKLASRPPEVPEAPGQAYRYFTVQTEKLATADVEQAAITFKVPKGDLEGVDVSRVQLQKYLKEGAGLAWKSLPTARVGEDATHVTFEAQTPGFSIFAIAGERGTEKRISLFAITLPAAGASAPVPLLPTEETPAGAALPRPEPLPRAGVAPAGDLSALAIAGTAAAAATGLAVLLFLRRRREKI